MPQNDSFIITRVPYYKTLKRLLLLHQLYYRGCLPNPVLKKWFS